MCETLFWRFESQPLLPTSTNSCGVTVAPMVYGGQKLLGHLLYQITNIRIWHIYSNVGDALNSHEFNKWLTSRMKIFLFSKKNFGIPEKEKKHVQVKHLNSANSFVV